MKWVPTLTDAYSDQRLDAAGEKAEILHHRAWAWAGHQETDGFIPTGMVARLAPTGARARVAALVRTGVWEETDGGYRFADWESVVQDVNGLRKRRENDAERQRRRREKLAQEKSQKEPLRDAEQRGYRDPTPDDAVTSHVTVTRQEVELDNPPNPPASRGDCDPISQPHPHCRGCGTSRRGQRQAVDRAAQEAAVAADLELRRLARTAPHCGDPTCDPHGRWRTTPTGQMRCPECNEVEILRRAQRPALAVVVGG